MAKQSGISQEYHVNVVIPLCTANARILILFFYLLDIMGVESLINRKSIDK